MFPALVARGPHAYGYMINLDGAVYFDKWSGRCDTEQADANLAQVPTDPRWLVGHTRYATHGSPEDNRNNHPLQHGKVIGVHNGILNNHGSILGQTGRQDPKTEVDSEAIFAAVNKWGHRGGLRKIQGDMVTVYVDLEKPDTLHIARSYGRPLVYARTKAGSFIFASEEQAITATGLDVGAISTLSPYTLLRVREGKIRSRVTYRAPQPVTSARSGYFTSSNEEWEQTVERMRAESRARMTASEDAMRARMQQRASRRGQIFAKRAEEEAKEPPKPARKISPPEPHTVQQRIADEEWNTYDAATGLYFYDDKWLSEAEYISAVMDDMEVPLG